MKSRNLPMPCGTGLPGLVIALLVVGAAIAAVQARAAESISLAGGWRFALDRKDAGISDKWFDATLANKISLPGILESQGYGDPIGIHTPWVLSLYDHFWYLRADYAGDTNAGAVRVPFISQPARHWLGAAWYQRDFDVPGQWRGNHLRLFMERPHWESMVWVDDRNVGANNSLCAPHEFDLGALEPGRHRLTVRVDNRMILPYRPDAHSVSDSLDDAWNGIVGRIELSPVAPVWIIDAQVYPHASGKSITVRGRLGNATGKNFTQNLGLAVFPVIDHTAPQLQPAGAALAQSEVKVEIGQEGGSFETELALGRSAALWDEFHPTLYHLTIRQPAEDPARGANGESFEIFETDFGLREFKAQGQEFTINGQPVYLRGTHFGGDFLLTGYPATDVDSWKKIIQTCKDWGLNHIRFHSWCPPEAAFEAADELGFYIQVECGMWNEFRPGGDMVKMLYLETDRIIHAYGNHPSFVLLSASNEAHGRWQQCLPEWVEHYRQADPRRLYTPDTGWVAIDRPEPVTGADYLVAGRIGPSRTRGETGWFGRDYDRSLLGVNVPVIAHELGQWCAYPDFDVIKKFTGFAQPGNYQVFQESAARHGVLAQDKKFAWASGRFQLACYKEEIEANLRTAGMAGFQLLDLHDYTGQGTALVGLLDPFWQGKGYASPEEFRSFCNATVPLARLAKRVFTTADAFDVECEIANFRGNLEKAAPFWKITDTAGKIVAKGNWPARTIPIGKNIPLGRVSHDLRQLAAPGKFELTVGLQDAPISNDWKFWLYPAAALPASTPSGLLVTKSWPEAERRLAAGGNVLFLPRNANLAWNSPPLARLPIFWNALMGPTWTRMLGLWCDTNHPALAEFPTGSECDWQWTELTHNARAMNLESLPPDLQPIVQAIDDWNRNYKLGLAFECRVGEGKLLACSVDFSGLETRPVARQLYQSLLDYAASPAFAPRVEVNPDAIRAMLFDTRIMRRLKAAAEADGEPADELIDGDPNTYWLGDGKNRHRHEISISFPEPEKISGLMLMPRQNQREHEGDLREYRVDGSADGTNWTEICHGALPSSFDPHTISFGKTLAAKRLKLTALSGFGTDTSAALAEVAVIYDGPQLPADGGTIEYQQVKSASPDIDAGGVSPPKKQN